VGAVVVVVGGLDLRGVVSVLVALGMGCTSSVWDGWLKGAEVGAECRRE